MLDITDERTGRTIDLPSGEVYFNDIGEGHPLVLLHGSGPGATGWSNFSENMKELGERFRCIAPEMPGWGRSCGSTFEDRRHDVTAIELLDALGIEKATFIGNSMGGATSVRVAARYPDRVSHLVTMGAGGPDVKIFGAGDGPTEGLKILNKAYLDPSPETMRELVEIMTFDPANATDELTKRRSETARARPDHLKNFIDGMARPRDKFFATAEQAASIAAPALLIHGRDDRVVHYESGLQLVALIRNSRLVLLNRCGHWAQVEHPAEFNRLVADFVGSN